MRRIVPLILSLIAAAASGCGEAHSGVDNTARARLDVTPTISWQPMGTPGGATKIAACSEGDGRVYALNTDRSIWVSKTGGTDGSWRYVITDTYVQQIFCAGNQLWVVNDDRTLWRNDGTDDAVNWVYVGRPAGAKQVTGATSAALFATYPIIYALNDDNSLWRSTSGRDGEWQYVGRPAAARRIAAGGGLEEARPFAANNDQTLWLNAGDGCDQYWHQITDQGVWITVGRQKWLRPLDLRNAEIAAASEFTLYVLRADHVLWKGTIANSDQLTTMRSDNKPQHCDGTQLVTNHCGDEGENCCAGGGCTADSTVCGAGNLCVHCGDLDGVCCGDGSCRPNLAGAPTVCGPRGTCELCGWTDHLCCPGNVCSPQNGTCATHANGWNYCDSTPPPPPCTLQNSDYSSCCNGQCLGNRFCNSTNQCQPRSTPPPTTTTDLCGVECPAGYHPTGYDFQANCGGTSEVKNHVYCAVNSGSFTTCGACPAGWHATDSKYDISCDTQHFTSNNSPNESFCAPN